MIHIARQGVSLGVFPPEEISRRLSAGELSPSDLAWREGMAGWVSLGSLPGLSVTGFTSPAFYPPPPSVPTSTQAAGSMVCGIFALVLTCTPVLWFMFFFVPPFLGIPLAIIAVILGHLGRGAIRRSGGTLQGAGMALTGLICGYITLLVGILFVVGIVLFGVALVREARATSIRADAAHGLPQVEREGDSAPPRPLEPER